MGVAEAQALIDAVADIGPSPDALDAPDAPVVGVVGNSRSAGDSLGSEHAAVVLTRIRALRDPAARLRAAHDLETELHRALGEVRTVIAEAAALVHAADPETLDARQQAPWA